MIKNLLILLFLISSSLTAQIKLSSCGNVAIGGTSPDCYYQWTKLNILHNNSTSYGIYSQAIGSYSNYGVYGRAYNGSSANYAFYGNATGSGGNRWAGYFSGNVYVSGSIAYGSDEGLKKNINPLNGSEILTKIKQLKPVNYEFFNETELRQKELPAVNARDGIHIGLLAQEVEKVFPELVMNVVSPLTDENGDPENDQTFVTTKAIDYNGLIAVLISTVQEQQIRLEELERKITATGK